MAALFVSKSGFLPGYTFHFFHVSEVAFSACLGNRAGWHLILLSSGFSGVGEAWMLIKITAPHHF